MLTIEYLGQIIELEWTDLINFKKYAAAQSDGLYGWDNYDTDEKFSLGNLEARLTRMCVKKIPLLQLNDSGGPLKIVDIGSGIGMIDLILSNVFPSADFYLIDKTELDLNIPGRWFSIDHPYYNSWNVTEDGIRSSAIDRNKFHLMSPTDPWPGQVDVVMSHISWCWHYLKDVYWAKVIDNLKIGGVLLLDIFNQVDQSSLSMISEISKEFNCTPHIIEIPNTIKYRTDHSSAPVDVTAYIGHHVAFKRNA